MSKATQRWERAKARSIRAQAESDAARLELEASRDILLAEILVSHKDLTARERQVLQLIQKLQTNKEIAAELFISERTVKFHVSAILAKFGVGSRRHLLRS